MKHHNLALRERKAVDRASEHLQTAQALVDDIAAVVAAKPSSTQDPTHLPVLDLDLWTGSLRPGEGWCLHPLFDRLLRRDVSPGPPDPLCSLLPVDFMQIPIKVHCFSQAIQVAAVPLCCLRCPQGSIGIAGQRWRRGVTPSWKPPPPTKVATVAKNEIWDRENLVGHFWCTTIWVSDPPFPPSPPSHTSLLPPPLSPPP